MKRKKLTKAEREEFAVARARADANAKGLRELAERALAKLDANDPHRATRRPPIPPTNSEREAARVRADVNARWLRELAERAQAELDAERSRES